MKSTLLISGPTLSLIAVLAMPAQTNAQIHSVTQNQNPPHYTVIDLGTLGGTFSVGYGINKAGQVGGGATLLDGNERPFVWYGGHMTALGTLGGLNGDAGEPNDKGEISVTAETSTPDANGEDFCGFGTPLQCLAAIWKNGVMTALPTLGGTNAESFKINNRGQVIGVAENSTRDGSCVSPQVLDFEAAIWEPNGEIRELPPLLGDSVGFAGWGNDEGQVVGSSGSCANSTLVPLAAFPHAVLWENGSPIYLGSLGGTMIGVAAGNNDVGEVDGASDLPTETPGFPSVQIHGFLWTKDRGMQDIGTVGNDFSSLPTSINNHGQMVGTSCDIDGNCRAFLRQGRVMTDLNALIPADSPLYLIFGWDINDAGQIAGQALETSTGDIHAFLATPRDPNRPGTEWRGADAGEADEFTERPSLVLPENARKMLRQQLGRRYHLGGLQ
jgi:probable HAF family extracellular repeat protein